MEIMLSAEGELYEAFYFWKRNSEEAVLLQIQGREAAITFDKSASGAGRILGRRAAGTHGCATRETPVRAIFIFEEETQRFRGRQHGRCRLAD